MMTISTADVRTILTRWTGSSSLAVINQARHDIVSMPENVVSPPLIALLADEDPDIRWCAADLLLDINPQAHLTHVAGLLLTDPDQYIRSGLCYRISEKAPFEATVEPLCHVLLNDSDSNARFWAALALGAIGDFRAVNALQQTLNDDGLNYEGVPVSHVAKYSLSMFSYR